MGLFKYVRKGRDADPAEIAVDLSCGCRYGPSPDRGWESLRWFVGCSHHELWSGDLEWIDMKSRG